MITDTLKLINPLVFIDLASTELDLKYARIIRISTIKILPDSTKIFVTNLINPEVEITPEAHRVHGISKKDVKNEKPFSNYSDSIANHLAGCDLIGFGIKRFSLPLLRKEFRKSKTYFSIKSRSVLDLMNIYHKIEPRDYSSAHKRFTKKSLTNYYDSKDRVEGMIDIFQGQLSSFQEIPRDVSSISKWLKK
jgi:DNA polymerase-3 subunit epsilon